MYRLFFGFREPYQVLVDASFCEYACQRDIDIAKRLDDVVQGHAKPSEHSFLFSETRIFKSILVITQCSIVQLYNLGPSAQGIVNVARTFERRKCNHTEAIDGDECIKSTVGASLLFGLQLKSYL